MMTTNHFPSVSFVFDEWKKIDVIYTLGIVSVSVYLHAEHSRQNAYLFRFVSFFLRVPLWAQVKLNHNNNRPGRNDSHRQQQTQPVAAAAAAAARPNQMRFERGLERDQLPGFTHLKWNETWIWYSTINW
jgi:hypothetical protein